MPSERLAFALRELQPGDWLFFEKFAAEFLAVELPSLRTMASSSGDKGRDGQLHRPDEDRKSMVQYSVAKDWKGKIQDTVTTLDKNFSEVTRLIYATNQVIGPAADDLKEELRLNGLQLDIRDASYFVERELTAPQREVASLELATRIVDPILATRGVGARTGAVLSVTEERVALLHLALEGYDADSDKGLTKSCFESLVFATLHDTDATSPKDRAVIQAEVGTLVPAGDRVQVSSQVNGALGRLSARGGPVKQVGKTTTYHLAFEEQSKVRERTARFLTMEKEFDEEIGVVVDALGLSLEPTQRDETVQGLRLGIESVLLHRGESFATAVRTGEVGQLDVEEVLSVLAGLGKPLPHLSREGAAEVILGLLEAPSHNTQLHLRRLADGYTLFAFLRQTPDVQKVVLDVFSHGEIWLDTSVVLPLIAETLLDDPNDRHYTTLLGAARDAGFKLYVTDGVVEEVERHLNRCLSFARTEAREWTSRVPFVYAAYALSGRGRSSFFDWLGEFRGLHTPEEDVAEYLSEVFKIEPRNLLDLAEKADEDLRAAVQEIWAERHDARRSASDEDLTPQSVLRLVNHDVECSVGVMELRKQSPTSPMGFRHWLLTLDRVAYDLPRALRERLWFEPPASPALSPDFMTELLRLGPLRADIEKELHVALPVVTAISRYESLPPELIDLAEETRRRYADQNERVVRRRVKEALNEARWRVGAEAREGVRGAEERIRRRLASQRGRS